MLSLATLSLLAVVPPSLLESLGPYDASVPSPTRVLGVGPGLKHTLLPDQDRVLQAIVAKSAGRASIEPYGVSTEGRPLRIVVITSPENRKRLGSIQRDLQALADGTLDTKAIERTPAVVWINQAIHGDEAASFESAMWLVYNLCASRNADITKLLEETVVIVNPCYNPDGRERFATWANSVARGDADPTSFEQREPSTANGRVNHYRFDLNRDRVSMSQDETRQEIAAFLKWNPQAYVDQHGEVDTYHFPPAALSIHARVDRARYHKWAEIFGQETGRAFDRYGFPYYVKDIFDLYYPGYLDSWTTLSGAIGMTHETNAQMIAREDSDGVVRTLIGGMERHFVAAVGVIRATANHRHAIVRSFAEFKSAAASGRMAGNRKTFVAASEDPTPLVRLQQILAVSGVKSELDYGQAQGRGESLWSNQNEPLPSQASHFLRVPMAQPQAAVALAVLETDSDFEKEFTEDQLRRAATQGTPYPERTEFYDLTGWSLPLVHGVQAWWLSGDLELTRRAPNPARPGDSSIGWIIRPGYPQALAVGRLIDRGIRVQQSPDEMHVGNVKYPPGSYIVHVSRNEGNNLGELRKLWCAEPLTSAYPETGRANPGAESVESLRSGRLGVLFGDNENPTDFGGVWYVLERELKLPFTAMTSTSLGRSLDGYRSILAPEGADVSSARLREWVQGGGCLVLLGGDPNRGGFLKLEAQSNVSDAGFIPGSLFRAEADPRSFVVWGTENRPYAAMISGGRYYRAVPGSTALRVVDSDENLLSGWAWPDRTEKAVRGTAVVHVERIGRGRVVWFATDPTDRALMAGHWPMLVNALVSGPRR